MSKTRRPSDANQPSVPLCTMFPPQCGGTDRPD